MPVITQIEGASRMMTRAEFTPSGIRIYFADGKEGVIPFGTLNLSEPPIKIMFTNPYELRIFTKTGEAPAIPWDFARHFVDPDYKAKSQQVAIRGRKALGKRLKQFRKAKRLTQAQLAHQAGISRVSLARIEAGTHSPRLETLIALAQALKISLSQLFYD